MINCNPIATPCDANVKFRRANHQNEILKDIPYQEAIGSLLYLSQGTGPDLTYIVNCLSRDNSEPTSEHWAATKRVVICLKGTVRLKLTHERNPDENINGFCDADDVEDRRSCTWHVFLFQGAALSWNSKKLALSSTKAEYMSLATAIQEDLCLKQLEEEFWLILKGVPIVLYCDNQSAIRLSGNLMYQARSKHIEVRYHFEKSRPIKSCRNTKALKIWLHMFSRKGCINQNMKVLPMLWA